MNWLRLKIIEIHVSYMMMRDKVIKKLFRPNTWNTPPLD